MNSVSFPSDDCLGAEEEVVPITKFNPILSRFLVPMHFFSKKGCGYTYVEALFLG